MEQQSWLLLKDFITKTKSCDLYIKERHGLYIRNVLNKSFVVLFNRKGKLSQLPQLFFYVFGSKKHFHF